jgi:hypothetical protein
MSGVPFPIPQKGNDAVVSSSAISPRGTGTRESICIVRSRERSLDGYRPEQRRPFEIEGAVASPVWFRALPPAGVGSTPERSTGGVGQQSEHALKRCWD